MFLKHFSFFVLIFYIFISGCNNVDYRLPAQISVDDRHLILTIQHLGGVPKSVTIKNNSPTIAKNIVAIFDETQTKSGLSQDASACKEVPPFSSCKLYLIPGLYPYGGDLFSTEPDEEMDEIFYMKGDNTNTIHSKISVLEYGSFFQGGYVFSINPDATRIKILASQKNADYMSASWILPNFPPVLPEDANDFYDGRPNTFAMDHFYAYGTFAARSCADYEIDENGQAPCDEDEEAMCFKGWYLPAICEIAPDPTYCIEATDNIYDNLYLLGKNNLELVTRWSSTVANPITGTAFYAEFALPHSGPLIKIQAAEIPATVRCVRLIEHIL